MKAENFVVSKTRKPPASLKLMEPFLIVQPDYKVDTVSSQNSGGNCHFDRREKSCSRRREALSHSFELTFLRWFILHYPPQSGSLRTPVRFYASRELLS